MAALAPNFFDTTGTVYVGGGGGGFTTVDTSTLACRLAHINPDDGVPPDQRAQLQARRRLLFDPTYSMPAACVVEVRGQRWRPVDARSIATFRDWASTPVYSAVEVVRAE